MLDNTKIRCWFSGGLMIKSNLYSQFYQTTWYKLIGVINLNIT